MNLSNLLDAPRLFFVQDTCDLMKETNPISIALKISTPRKTRWNTYLGKHQEISHGMSFLGQVAHMLHCFIAFLFFTKGLWMNGQTEWVCFFFSYLSKLKKGLCIFACQRMHFNQTPVLYSYNPVPCLPQLMSGWIEHSVYNQSLAYIKNRALHGFWMKIDL